MLFQQDLPYVYDNGQARVQLDTRRGEGHLDAGMALGNWGELRVGLMRGTVDVGTKVGDPTSPRLTGKYATGGVAGPLRRGHPGPAGVPDQRHATFW